MPSSNEKAIQKAIAFFWESLGARGALPRRKNLRGMGFVDGRWVEGDETFPVENPATGLIIGECFETRKRDIDRAFRAARIAHFRWHHLVILQEKRQVFETLWRLLDRSKEELATLFTYEGGKIISNSRADIVESYDTVKAAHNTINDDGGTVDQEAQLFNKLPGTLAWPYGVEFAIKPFNFIAIYWWKVAASVMAGTAVIVKEAEQIPFSAMCMTALFHRALREALGDARAKKLSALVQLLQGHGETVGRYATEQGTYDVVSATGSWRMGAEVASVAAGKIKPQRLELSGVNRALAWYDYPLEKAADEIALAAFGDGGQRCVSLETTFIPKTLFKKTVALVIARAKKIRIGDPLDPRTDVGPVISRVQRDAIEGAMQRAGRKGFRPLLGGYPLTPENVDRAKKDGFYFDLRDFRKGGRWAGGHWWVPTVFVNLPFYHEINRFEVFGPVTVLNELEWTYRNRISSREFQRGSDRWIDEYIAVRGLDKLPRIREFLQGIALLNDNLFGLSCGCFTYDARYWIHFLRLAEYGLRYGGRGTTGAEVDDRTQFGGGKHSGYGREGGSVKHARRQAQFYLDAHPVTRLAQRDE